MAIKVQGITVIDDGRNIINGIGASFTGIVTANTFSGDFSGDGSNITGLATNLSELTNDVGFVTFTNNNQLTNGAGFITTSFTNTNQLTNGAGFITNNVSGVVTATKLHVGVDTGFHNEDLVVTGDARITGILTIGTASITLDPNAKTLTGLDELQIGSGNTAITIKKNSTTGDIIFEDISGKEASVGIGTTVSIKTTGIITATTFSGSGASLTDIPNGALTNSNIAIGGITLNLGDTDATPAFNLSDATAYPYTSLTGITTSIVGDTTPQLGGNLDLNSKFITGTGGINVTGVVTATTFSGSGASLTNIANGALTNSSIAIGGVTLNLGDTDATPAFNLSDATAYPYASLTGITTEIVGDTTPQLGGNLDINSKFITGTGGINVTGVVTATTFDGNVTGNITGDVSGNAGTATSLSSARNFSITGDVVASAVSFDGTGNVVLSTAIQPNSVALATDTTGDFVQSITGTANEVTVSATSGENSTPQIGLPNDVTIGQDLTVTRNIDVDGHTELDDVNVSGALTATSLNVTDKLITTGIGISIANGAGNTAYIEGPSEIWIDPHPFGVGQTSGSVRIRGDLYVDGTEFIVNVDKVQLGDFRIGIATTAGTNALLDGGGLGIGSESIEKTITWNNATSALMSSENWNLASGKHYEINGTDVLTSNTLGSGIINSSLTSVGTLGALTVSGDVTANGNIIGDNATNISGINSVTASDFFGSGANLTSIPNGALANSSITIGGVTLNLGDTDATPAFNLSDATAYPYTSLTGITTEIVGDTTPQLGGNLDLNSNNITGTGDFNVTGVITATTFSGSGASLTDIPNEALANSSITIGGVTLNLGDTDATPAFNLSDATAYPYTSLTGITTEILGDTTPQLGGNLDLNSKVITGTGGINVTGVVTATSFSGSGANLTSIPNSALTNDSVSFGGVSLDLGASDATPAFDLSDATAYPYTSLTGISTSIIGDTTPQLGGNLDINSKVITGTGGINVTGVITATTFSGSGASLTDIPNEALANSSITIGGVTLNLGATDATPAFNLSDATAYPYTSLTGITTEIVGDTTPQLGGNLDINSKVITGTGGINVTGVVTATSFSGSGSALTELTGASAATYGDASNVAQIVVDANGRITAISDVTISGGDTVSITTTAADILSVSSGAISADDAGADKIVFWDDSEGKLTYLTVGTNLTVTDTTISASGGSGPDPVIMGMIF